MGMRIVIADLDGTLSDYGHRLHLYKERDYDAFNKAGKDDRPIENICNILRALDRQETEIVVMTARSSDNRPATQEWLRLNDVPCDRLIMRPVGDQSPDDECKRKLFEEKIDYSDVWFVLEDRKSVVDMWRGEGLTCLQVAPGDF
jgi:phosphoglycolate phosphatase-like HAD superfamily hydrolase